MNLKLALIKHTVCVKYALVSLFLLRSVVSAGLSSNPNADVNDYIKSLDEFFISQHLVTANSKRLNQLEFEFIETSKNFTNSQQLEPFINIMTIEDIVIVKVFNLPLFDGKIEIDRDIEQILMQAYLFSEALATKNKVNDIWGLSTQYRLHIPDAMILGLLAFKDITNLNTKVLSMNQYRSQQKKLKLQDFQLNFQEDSKAQASNKQALTLSALSFVGTWKSWLENNNKYPNWNEIVKFRGDWKEYFKTQLPDTQKWMETQSQWLDFHLLNILKRQPFDKLTLQESKDALEKIWQQSDSLWVDMSQAITDQDLELISYLKKKVIALQRVINPYYYPLIEDFKNLLVQKWFKSPPLGDNEKQKSVSIAELELKNRAQKLQTSNSDNDLNKELVKPEFSSELTQQLQQLHQDFQQKLAEKHLKSQIIQEFISQETLESRFIRSEEKKASNHSPMLYKQDPVSYYLNLHN